MVVPVAYGGALAGIRRGFLELRDRGICDREPRLLATEAYGTLMKALASGAESPVANEGYWLAGLLRGRGPEHSPGAGGPA